MPSHYKLVFTLVILHWMLAGCAPRQINLTATPDSPPTDPTTPAPTSTLTSTPTLVPTAVGGANGAVVYDDDENIVIFDLSTQERKVIVSRSELETLLPQDRSDESWGGGGHKRPLDITLSPDTTKAYIPICADLDERALCIYEGYVYHIEDKTVTKLERQPDEYTVGWQWSPDGSKLVGAGGITKIIGTAVNVFETRLTFFYAINADGTDLKSLFPITTETSRWAWRPDGQVIHPLTSLSNFKAVHVDGSKIENVSIDGLAADDTIDCLDFSLDGENVAFAINREVQKDHYRVYRAKADFTGLGLVAEFDSDSRYGCEIAWSPDQRFVHLSYDLKIYPLGGVPDPLDFVFNVENQASIEVPKSSNICGWTPDSHLVYQVGLGVKSGVKIRNLSNSSNVDLPEPLDRCPLRWMEQDRP